MCRLCRRASVRPVPLRPGRPLSKRKPESSPREGHTGKDPHQDSFSWRPGAGNAEAGGVGVRGAGLLTGAVKRRPRPGSCSRTPKPLSVRGGSGLARGPGSLAFIVALSAFPNGNCLEGGDLLLHQPPRAPQQRPSTSSQEQTLWGPQVGFASLGSSLAGWWAGPCLRGWWPPLVSPLGRGAGNCCPRGVTSWPASGLGLGEGAAPSGEKSRQEQAASWRPPYAALTCPVTWACLPTCLHRFLISCHTRCLGIAPGVPPRQ